MSHSTDFLYTQEVPKETDPRKTVKRVLWILGISFFLVAAWVIALLIAAGNVYSASLEGRDALMRARDAAVELDFSEAHDELVFADDRFSDASRSFFVLQTIRFVPWVGRQIKATDALLTSSRSVTEALIEIVVLGDELVRLSGYDDAELMRLFEGVDVDASFNDLPSETKRAVLSRLSNAASDLERTEHRVAIARDELTRIPDGSLFGPIGIALAPLDRQLLELEALIHTMAISARLLPEFGGLDTGRNHLLLFLNNGELRPGGGFIGTFGVLSVRDGDIVSLQTIDVYNLDDPAAPHVGPIAPPPPLTRYLNASHWFFRDSNWSPDFAVSSKKSLELFRQEVLAIPPEERASVQPNISFHNVIGFTPDYAADLLQITGPISVGGQTFTAENVFDLLEFQVEFGFAEQGIPVAQRKEILADLVEEMKSRLFALPLSEWVKVLDATEEALRTKQFVLYSESTDVEDVITRVGWGGRVPNFQTDFLLFVDANLASLKSDPSVKRSINYQIRRNSAGEYVARASMRYDHQGRFDYKTTRYRTYTRLFVPKGSRWVRTIGSLQNDKTQNPSLAEGETDIFEELGYTVFGAFTSIEPQNSRELIFEYILPQKIADDIEAGHYRLNAVKQIGAADYPLTLDLDFDKNVSNASPPEEVEEWGDDIYRVRDVLDEDHAFSVQL